VLAACLAAFFVYDTAVAPDPRPDDDVAAAMLPTLGELPSDWSRGADAPNLAPGTLAECDAVLGEPFTNATEAAAAATFRFDNGPSLVVVESFLLDGDDEEFADEIVRAYGTGCVATQVAQRAVGASGLENAGTERLELDTGNAIVRARRVGGDVVADGAWVVDVGAVAVDRGVVVFVRASQGGTTGGVNTDELVALVVPRIADQVST